MSSLTMVKVTNIWTAVREDPGINCCSEVHIEANLPFRYRVDTAPRLVRVYVLGATANLPEGKILVRDGLVGQIEVRNYGGQVEVEISLEHRSTADILWTRPQMPARLTLRFDRQFLRVLFGDKVVVIDPGHGGRDFGYRGPVNLWEKDVVRHTAHRLADILGRCGSTVVFTRSGDETVPEKRRIACARENGAHVFVSLHTHWSANPRVSGPAVLFNPLGPGSEEMASLVSAALVEKVRLRPRRSRADPFLRLLGPVPGLLVEVVTISDWVEEGLLRSSRFHQKVAEGIFNGLKDYYCKTRGRG